MSALFENFLPPSNQYFSLSYSLSHTHIHTHTHTHTFKVLVEGENHIEEGIRYLLFIILLWRTLNAVQQEQHVFFTPLVYGWTTERHTNHMTGHMITIPNIAIGAHGDQHGRKPEEVVCMSLCVITQPRS